MFETWDQKIKTDVFTVKRKEKLLGVDEPVEEFEGRIIGIVYRQNDVEDKLIMAPAGAAFDKKTIEKQIDFQEKYYITSVEASDK